MKILMPLWRSLSQTAVLLKKGFQMAHVLVDNFTRRCLNFKCQMEAVMVLYTEVYRNMQKKAKKQYQHIPLHRVFCIIQST
jgi:hypothetical protein